MAEDIPIITRLHMLMHPLAGCMSDDAHKTALVEWAQDAKKFILIQQELLAEAQYWCDENTPTEVLDKIDAVLNNRRIK
jgi:hypothetical protein